MSAAQTYIINFSDIVEKRDLLQKLGELQGLHEIRIKKRIRRGTKEQRGYYWVAIVPAFIRALAEQGETVTEDEAHEAFKYMFLRGSKKVKNPVTGEEYSVPFIGSTESLEIDEKSMFISSCLDFLAQYFNIALPDSALYTSKT